MELSDSASYPRSRIRLRFGNKISQRQNLPLPTKP
jgi:hypothetical protein